MERAERKSERDKDRESRRESVRDILSFKRCLSTPVIKSQVITGHHCSHRRSLLFFLCLSRTSHFHLFTFSDKGIVKI